MLQGNKRLDGVFQSVDVNNFVHQVGIVAAAPAATRGEGELHRQRSRGEWAIPKGFVDGLLPVGGTVGIVKGHGFPGLLVDLFAEIHQFAICGRGDRLTGKAA